MHNFRGKFDVPTDGDEQKDSSSLDPRFPRGSQINFYRVRNARLWQALEEQHARERE